MTANRATGAEDPALAETSWPMPTVGNTEYEHSLVNNLLWSDHLTNEQRLEAVGYVRAYRALIEDGTTAQQLKRLAALRRVHRRRRAR